MGTSQKICPVCSQVYWRAGRACSQAHREQFEREKKAPGEYVPRKRRKQGRRWEPNDDVWSLVEAKSKQIIQKECPICLEEFYTENINKIYCASFCAGNYLEAENAPIFKPIRSNCHTCGRFFLPRKRVQRFCQDSCAREKQPLAKKICLCCLEGYIPSTSRQKYCKPDCANRYRHKERFNLYARDDYKCIWCSSRFNFQRLCLDHIVPIMDDGQDTASNLVTSCKLCNGKKSDKRVINASKILAKIAERNKAFEIDPNMLIKFTYEAKVRKMHIEMRREGGSRLEDT